MRFGRVDPAAVGGKPDTVGAEQGERLLHHGGSVGQDVVQTAPVDAFAATLAVIGEPEPARLVEHQVVGPAQWAAVALAVEHLDGAALQIDPFDPATGEPRGLVGVGHVIDGDAVPRTSVHRKPPLLATRVVVAVSRAMPFGPAPGLGDHGRTPVVDAPDDAAVDVDDVDRAIGGEDGTLGKSDSLGQDVELERPVDSGLHGPVFTARSSRRRRRGGRHARHVGAVHEHVDARYGKPSPERRKATSGGHLVRLAEPAERHLLEHGVHHRLLPELSATHRCIDDARREGVDPTTTGTPADGCPGRGTDHSPLGQAVGHAAVGKDARRRARGSRAPSGRR